MTLVKICGIATRDMAEVAVDAGADALGFIFFPRSPRHVAFDQAARLAAYVPDSVDRVGVFVDADDDTIARGVDSGRLNVVQCHGSESPERLAAIRARHGCRVWKAIPVSERDDLARAEAYVGIADRLLFDARTFNPDMPGGVGARFDWRFLQDAPPAMDWGLSGGLDVDNVARAIAVAAPPLVDVSSGVEDRPGVKSATRIRAFMNEVRRI